MKRKHVRIWFSREGIVRRFNNCWKYLINLETQYALSIIENTFNELLMVIFADLI